ncbi:hypothetical protein GGI15_004432 [Coemansia interrupta]|uniref:Lysophospholipase n=1 Tax=Coemansia interrupta TaxID=1126814 RepID=A0A9W8H4F0_9FUNG|nr:hypothetical protein GGI15_004432 [Coemansia interrupta]
MSAFAITNIKIVASWIHSVFQMYENDTQSLHGEEKKDNVGETNPDASVVGQIESFYNTVSENLSTLLDNSKDATAATTSDAHTESKGKDTSDNNESTEAPTNAWYTSVTSTLESIASIGSNEENSNQNDAGSDEAAQKDAENLTWMTTARDRLDELSQKVQDMDWGSFKAESAKLKQQAQAQLNQKVDETKAALENAVHGMLPEQLQKPWITACAQTCLDQEIHPELLQSASVRVGRGICGQEADFQIRRAERIRKHFAEFIGVPEASVDPRDIPVIAVAGSGGGFRAMVSTIGSYRAMHEAGLAQCVMYDAAVSGSSWAMAGLHTYGHGDPVKVLDSVREAMQTSMFSTANLMSFVGNNDNIAKRVFTDMAARYLLAAAKSEDEGKMAEKTNGSRTETADGVGGDSGIGLFTRVADSVVPDQLKYLYHRDESLPTPLTVDELVEAAKSTVRAISVPPLSIVELYGALLFKQLIVQHERGPGDKSELNLDPRWMKLSSQRADVDRGLLPMPIYTAVRHFLGTDDNNPSTSEEHRYQWFEFNPYEVGSIDHGAWMPSWAFGRPMINGKEQFKIGETHFGSIMGTVASAFCASVKAMVMEIYMAVPGAIRSAMDPLLDRFEHGTEISHLIPPYTLYNPFYKTKDLSKSDAELAELEGAPFLSLMDAGLENNLPFAPLLRPERGVDVIVCLDSSANIDIMPWFARAEAWADVHGAERWPWGARPWTADPLRPSKAEVEMSSSALKSTKQVSKRIEDRVKHKNMRCVIFDHPLAPAPSEASKKRRMEPTISVMYLPLLPNPKFRDPDFNPETADFCATFTDKWTAEQVDKLADLTSLNFSQEIERIRAAVKRAYERKRAFRMYREMEAE